jgi:post-segregation antitoxin (ccd killing protein)
MSNARRDELRASVRRRRAAAAGELSAEEAAAVADWQPEWLEENQVAIESSNKWVEKHGLPLAQYRQF